MVTQIGKYIDHNVGNILCAVDCETTGLEAGVHDIIQICVLPLNTRYEPNTEISPFYMDLQPKRPENWSSEASKVNKKRLSEVQIKGTEPYRAADLFDEWFERLNLGFNKRIMVLAQNWNFDYPFIVDWLGWKSADRYFDARYRDLMPAIMLMNDRSAHRFEPIPFIGSLSLRALCNKFGISYEGAHDALTDCMLTAEIYRNILKLKN